MTDDDDNHDCGTAGRINDWQGRQKCSEKICLAAALPTTNPTWFDPDSNLGRHGGKPGTDRLSYGKARQKQESIPLIAKLRGYSPIASRDLATATVCWGNARKPVTAQTLSIHDFPAAILTAA
jgi:hypothetical protein